LIRVPPAKPTYSTTKPCSHQQSADFSRFSTPIPAPNCSWLQERLIALAILFTAEIIILSVLFDTKDLLGTTVLTRFLSDQFPIILQGALAAATLYTILAFVMARNLFSQISTEYRHSPISWQLLAGHVGALLLFLSLSRKLFSGAALPSGPDLTAVIWLLTGACLACIAATALVPVKAWLALISGSLGITAAAITGGAFSSFGMDLARIFWEPLSGFTFSAVKLLLSPFLPVLVSDRASLVIGSSRFSVIISPGCSGLEGAMLMLVVTAAWLWLFRHECRFPRALVIMPAGIFLILLLNCVRIAALVLIGHAGAPQIAMGGFHSQAGWIAFNAVALGLVLPLRRWTFFTNAGPLDSSSSEIVLANPAVWYLAPFASILIAGMVSSALSAGFEWLYPLRFLVAAGILFYFRRMYRDLDWRIGWVGLLAGIGVFLMWLGLAHSPASPADNATARALSSMPWVGSVAWVTCRMLAAMVTVPIAEELAFRGFLLRRVVSEKFEAVNRENFGLVPIAVSSLAFGLMHGNRWFVGTLAGIVYALAYRTRGRIGDAIAAHAFTNLLLAATMLQSGSWQTSW
jgi:exosortase E/protease (VPEID-CTERM system)